MGLTKAHSALPDDPPQASSDFAVARLIEALASRNPDARRRSVLDLRHQHQAIPALLAMYPQEPDPATREALFTVLAEHDDLDVAQAFAADLGIEDVATRNSAATALSLMPNAVALLIDDLLSAPQARIRTMVVMVLSGLQHVDVPAWLDGVIRRDVDENVVAAAVDAILETGRDLQKLLDLAVRRFPDNPYLMFVADTYASSP